MSSAESLSGTCGSMPPAAEDRRVFREHYSRRSDSREASEKKDDKEENCKRSTMNPNQDDSSVLQIISANAQNLAGLVDYSTDSIVSKTILDKPAGTITLFAFDEGQKLSEHTAPYDAVIQVVDGGALLMIGGRKIPVSAGQIIIMPANVPHAVMAQEKFKMLLIMIRALKKE